VPKEHCLGRCPNFLHEFDAASAKLLWPLVNFLVDRRPSKQKLFYATQVRDDVIRATGALSRAVYDVTDHVTVTSSRLSDVTERAHNVSTLIQQEFSDSWINDISLAVSVISSVARWRVQ